MNPLLYEIDMLDDAKCIRLVSESRNPQSPKARHVNDRHCLTSRSLQKRKAIARCSHHSIAVRQSPAARCTDRAPQPSIAVQLAPLLPDFLAAVLEHSGQVDQQSLCPAEQPP